MKPQSYEVLFRSDTVWSVTIRQSKCASSVLCQVLVYGKGMKKDKLPSNIKSNPNFFKVF